MTFNYDKPDFVWDTYEITKNQADFLIESGECDEEDEAFNQARQDSDLITFERERLTEALTEKLQEINPDGYWHAEVSNFGWRNQDGHKQFIADDGQTFLREVLPETDCTFRIYFVDKEIRIQNFHHDSPVGNEWYTITCDQSAYKQAV